MLATALGATALGIEARPIDVEVELTQGLPYFSIIGLVGTAVQEARYRIQSALRASELALPHKRVTINLAPAGLRKDGAALDLPMALGLLVAAGLLESSALDGTLALGELALSGQLRPVRGVLPATALAARRGCRRIIVPRCNGPEALALGSIPVVAPDSLSQLVSHLRGRSEVPAAPQAEAQREISDLDLSEVRGQGDARRALEICAAGGHNLLFLGHPGSGKTMLARRLPTILPPLERNDRILVTQIRSVAGLTLEFDGLAQRRPFRAPHSSISQAGLVGGGNPVRPGEVSLAHEGILFLDEMPELPRRVLESLRQPLEDGFVTIVRARQAIRLPANFQLLGSANPCPCGWLGHSSGRCMCRPEEIRRYAGRISGALLDRMDMVVDVPTLGAEELLVAQGGECSRTVRERVLGARAFWASLEPSPPRPQTSTSPLRGNPSLERIRTSLGPKCRNLVKDASEKLGLSARGVDRILKVGRTIANLEQSETIRQVHLMEALRFRRPASWGTR
ncbi:MAG: YifB family Mg chelatase-like AAA ATPase [Myxococcota bacterium]